MIEARAIQIQGKGDVSVLKLGTTMVRAPGPGELLVEVAAAAVNRADILQRRGFYPAPPGVVADVPGLEYAGTVAAVGEGVADLAVGARVMGITAGGAMATHVVVHAREAIPVPVRLSLVDAAAIPEVFLTAYDALYTQAQLRIGQTVLIHAVASGVGTAALQLVNAAGGLAIGTARSQAKLDACRDLGLVHGIVADQAKFADPLRAITHGRMANIIVDTIGAAYLAENIAALASRGTLVGVGLLGGASAEIPLALLLAKRATVVGTVLRSRPLEEKIALTQAFCQHVMPLIEQGRIKPVVDKVFPMADIAEAHKRMEANQSVGKIVMSW